MPAEIFQADLYSLLFSDISNKNVWNSEQAQLLI